MLLPRRFFIRKRIYVKLFIGGDVPSFSSLKSMNYLSYKVFEYYYNNTKVKILDIGISTENGIPNYGLCEFKENIGCTATTRFSLML